MSETIQFRTPTGDIRVFTGQPDLDVLMGLQGRMMPPLEYIEDEVPGAPGARPRLVKIKPRNVSLPIRIKGVDANHLRNVIRGLLEVVSPVSQDASQDVATGKIQIIDGYGGQRELRCVYVSGLEIDESHMLSKFQKAVPIFRAHDPFWYDTVDTSYVFDSGSVVGWFPIFPLSLASSSVFSSGAVTNFGSVYTWPTWTIQGPGVNPILKNLTTGQTITLNGLTLGEGESCTITLTDFSVKVKKNDGTNLYQYVTADSEMWPLVVGENTVEVQMSGTTPLISAVNISYRNRYWSA